MSRSPRDRSTWCPGIEIAEAFPTAAAVRKEIDHLSVGANNIDLGRTDEYTSVISPAPVAEDSVLAIVMTGNGQRVLPRGRKIGSGPIALGLYVRPCWEAKHADTPFGGCVGGLPCQRNETPRFAAGFD